MLKSRLMNFVKELGRFLGLEIRRTKSADFNYRWLQNLNIHTIIDIGASVGEFGKEIHKLLPEARIYAFEPLKDSYLKLVSNLKHLPEFRAFNFALGGTNNDNAEIHHCQYSPSSSLLNMAALHKELFPISDGGIIEKISIRCLDTIAEELSIKENILIKLDVQGYEDKVIAGGKKVFSEARLVIAETSFEELYQGQPLFGDIYDIMKEQGFLYIGTWGPIVKNPVDGCPLCCDSIFIRK